MTGATKISQPTMQFKMINLIQGALQLVLFCRLILINDLHVSAHAYTHPHICTHTAAEIQTVPGFPSQSEISPPVSLNNCCILIESVRLFHSMLWIKVFKRKLVTTA